MNETKKVEKLLNYYKHKKELKEYYDESGEKQVYIIFHIELEDYNFADVPDLGVSLGVEGVKFSRIDVVILKDDLRVFLVKSDGRTIPTFAKTYREIQTLYKIICGKGLKNIFNSKSKLK